MGDAADDMFDFVLSQEVEIELLADAYMKLSDKDLIEETKNSRSPIIMSIRKWKPLSPKQKRVLANYIAHRDFEQPWD